MTDSTYVIEFPDYFDDEAAMIESKGFFADLSILVGEVTYRPTIYDAVRLSQTIADVVARDGFFCEGMVIVISRVTREHIERAIHQLSLSGFAEFRSQ